MYSNYDQFSCRDWLMLVNWEKQRYDHRTKTFVRGDKDYLNAEEAHVIERNHMTHESWLATCSRKPFIGPPSSLPTPYQVSQVYLTTSLPPLTQPSDGSGIHFFLILPLVIHPALGLWFYRIFYHDGLRVSFEENLVNYPSTWTLQKFHLNANNKGGGWVTSPARINCVQCIYL